MRLEAGDVILLPFPFTDLSSRKTRPALVLSTSAYNQSSRDVIVCGMTSNLSNAAHSVLVENDDMGEGKLVATSRVKVDKVVALQQSITRKKVGRVKDAVVAQVVKEFLTLFPGTK